jgi:hypothetical protein
MTNQHTDSDGKQSTTTTKAARAVKKATAKAERSAGSTAQQTAHKAEEAALTVASAAETGGEKAAGAARTAGRGVTGAIEGIEAGRKAVSATAGRVGAAALTAWSVFKNRKLIAGACAAAVTTLSVVSYAAGRRTERNRRGPVARWTGGRL